VSQRRSPGRPLTAKQKKDQRRGCGCLALLALLVVGGIANACGGGEEPESRPSYLAPLTTTATLMPTPAPTTASSGRASPTRVAAPTTAATSTTPTGDPDPRPRPQPQPQPQPQDDDDSGSSGSVYYPNCTAARAAGAAPIRAGEPGYRSALDRNNDGVACE
jgi:hypothetical protein